MTNTFALAEPDSRCFVKGCDTENSTYQTAFQKGGFAEFAIPYHEGTTCATNNEFEYFKVDTYYSNVPLLSRLQKQNKGIFKVLHSSNEKPQRRMCQI